MTVAEWEESLPAIDRWMLTTYALSISLKNGAVLKKDRRKVRELLNWSQTRRVYCEDRARELYDQWIRHVQLAEESLSV